jgi:ribosomal protein S18 acetylase RimI-like enzyme
MKAQAQTSTGRIRPLNSDDLEPVIEIDKSLTGNSRRGFFQKRLTAALEQPADYVYVGLEDGGSLVGYALAKMVDGEYGTPGARASLDSIGVDPAHQGRGAGHGLLDAIEEVLVHKGVHALSSQVDWSDQALVSFLAEAGFSLAARIVLSRDTSELPVLRPLGDSAPDPLEIDHSAPEGDDPDALSRDIVPVRSMTEADIAAVISIDRKTSGRERSAYYRRKQHEVLHQSGVRVSLVAEDDGFPVGFIMARVDFGEFGRTSRGAVMDAIGVDPAFQGHGVGQALMSQLMANLGVLRVDYVRTEIDWNDTGLISYLGSVGFAPAQTVVLKRNLSG